MAASPFAKEAKRPLERAVIEIAPIEMPADSERKTPCSAWALEFALTRHMHFEVRSREKNFKNLIPIERFKFSVGEKHEALVKTQSALQSLNKVHSTLALIYGRTEPGRSCVWLINGRNIVASANMGDVDPEVLVARLREGLDVQVASRRRSKPHGKRSDCGPSPIASTKQPELRVLAEVAAALLPLPIGDALMRTQVERLVIVPTGSMRAIPFAALPLGDGLMIDRFAIIVSPNASILDERRSNTRIDVSDPRKPSSTKSIVVGAPDLRWDAAYCWDPLPFAEMEAANAAKVFGDRNPLTGAAATHSELTRRFQEEQASLNLIWLATHGYADPVDPINESFVALSEKHLDAVWIRTFSFERRPIVVLSACETGLGKVFVDGIFGLAEAWRYAGAAQVVTSLWDVSDEGTKSLMDEFARNLKRRGVVGAEFALAEAMRTVRVTHGNPAVWAAFAVQGEPSSQ